MDLNEEANRESIGETVAELVESRTEFQFIRSPSKRKFFGIPNELNKQQTPDRISQGETEMEDLRNNGHSEVQFQHKDQNKQDEHKEPLQSKYVADVLDDNYGDKQVYEPTTTPSYTKLQFSTIQKVFDDPEKGEDLEEKPRILLPQNEETVQEALLAVFFSSFNLIFSIGIFYSHYAEGLKSSAELTLLIIAVASIVLTFSYLFNRKLRKIDMWKTSKIFTLVTLIPFTLPLSLSLADLVFALKEKNSRTYTRPWTNTRPIYLVESLFLVLPQAVLQSVLLLEDVDSIPSLKGFLMLFGCGTLIMGVTFARVRYDSDSSPERFGSGIDKLIRCTIVYGNKGLWVITYVCLAVSIRVRYPDSFLSTLIALVALTLLFEVPVLLPALACCTRCVAKTSGMFFFIPQFASLLVVMLWTNTDLNIYVTNVGICALGAYTLFESLALMGWLLDSCMDREMDILPIYPHFLGDLYVSKNPKETRHT